MFGATILAAMLQLSGGISTPPPPPPPPVAKEPIVKASITRAALCVDANDDRGRADRASRGLKAPIGTSEWNKARETVVAYLAKREVARQCITQLESVGVSSSMSNHDRSVLTDAEAGLIRFWLEQNAYATEIAGRLLGASVGSDVPIYLTPGR